MHDLSEVSSTLGINIERSDDVFTYDVSEQILNLCEVYNLIPNYKVKVPLPANEIVYPHANGLPYHVDAYTSIIGSIMYIARVARVDVLFAVTQISQFREVPTNLDYKSFRGTLALVGSNLINWICKKQDATAQSTDESEIIAASYSLRELNYFKY